MHSSGLQPTSSSHLLLLDRSACQASFWCFWDAGTLWKGFHFSCHPNDFNPCMHMKELCESLAYSAVLQFSFSAALTVTTQQHFWSQTQVYLPGVTTAVSVKAFSFVKRKSIFIWYLQLEPTLRRNLNNIAVVTTSPELNWQAEIQRNDWKSLLLCLLLAQGRSEHLNIIKSAFGAEGLVTSLDSRGFFKKLRSIC